MSLDKAIKYGKEHRKKYRGSKTFDKSCRNHGGGSKYECPYCKSNRLHSNETKKEAAEGQLKELEI